MGPKKIVFGEDGEDATMHDVPPSNQAAVTDDAAAVAQEDREEDMLDPQAEHEEEEEEEEQRVKLVSFLALQPLFLYQDFGMVRRTC